MALMIDLMDETGSLRQQDEELIRGLLRHAAEMEEIHGEAELSVSFVDDEAIREVNRDYRDKDRPTDVISFAMEETIEGEEPVAEPEGMPRMLGDIIISAETAERQAEEYGHSRERELGFLALHGFLHLLGYDHMTEADERKMFGRQDAILDSFGLGRGQDGRP